jgi:hypothetical protein
VAKNLDSSVGRQPEFVCVQSYRSFFTQHYAPSLQLNGLQWLFSPGQKRPGHIAHYRAHPCIAEVKSSGAIPSLRNTSS